MFGGVKMRSRTLIITAAILLSAVICILILSSGNSDLNRAEASTVQQKMYTSIEIQDGDTLWSLAETYGQKYKDYSVFIDEVCSINKLSGDRITAGACLLIPVYR